MNLVISPIKANGMSFTLSTLIMNGSTVNDATNDAIVVNDLTYANQTESQK